MVKSPHIISWKKRLISYSHNHTYHCSFSAPQNYQLAQSVIGMQWSTPQKWGFTWMISESVKYFCYQKMWWHQPISQTVPDSNVLIGIPDWWFMLGVSIHGASRFPPADIIPVGRGRGHHTLSQSWNLDRTFPVRASPVWRHPPLQGSLVVWKNSGLNYISC